MTTKKQLNALNILKGIAMIMIIVVHNRHFIMKDMSGLRQLINYGQMGVELFFMISGMALCFSWYHLTEHSSFSYHLPNWLMTSRHFIHNRYLRLAPGYILLLLINLLLNIVMIDLFHYSPGYIMNREPLGMLSNIFFLHGFFPQYINQVVPSGWYIGTTFILYALFPLLVLLFECVSLIQKKCIVFLPLLLWGFNFWMIKQIAVTYGNDFYPSTCSFMFYFFLNHLPVFSLGILLFFQEKDDFSSKCPLWLSSILAISCTLFSMYLYLQPDEGNYLFAILPFVCGIAFYWCAVAFIHLEHAHKKAKKTKKSIFIDFLANCGKHSYGMYLMHSFICWYAIKAFTLALNERGIPYNDLLLYGIFLLPSILLVYLLGYFADQLLTYIDKFLRK